MRQLFAEIDRLLRGEFTGSEDLAQGEIRIRARSLVIAGLVLGALYGLFMGIYGVTRSENASVLQMLASMVKVPLLFLLTLLVTFPSLYVFSALVNSKLRFDQTQRLLLAAIAVDLALLASFGPVTGFFTLSTTSYPFMVVLNVLVFGISGVAGLVFLRRALDKVFVPPRTPSTGAPPVPSPPEGDAARNDSAVDAKDRPQGDLLAPTPTRQVVVYAPPPPETSKIIFRLWAVIFGIVGAQMGWILRPFIGDPARPFTLFRERDANFFSATLEALRQLFS